MKSFYLSVIAFVALYFLNKDLQIFTHHGNFVCLVDRCWDITKVFGG